MTDKAKRRWCRGVVSKWRSRMFLGEWMLNLAYAKEDQEMETGGRPSASCWADPVYMQATITIYPCFWNGEADERTHTLIHEMAHCHTQRVWNTMRDFAAGVFTTPDHVKQQIEQLTQRIANITYQQEWGKK